MGLEELVRTVQVDRKSAGERPPQLVLSFEERLSSVPSWLTEVFDGYSPAYAYGVCRAVDAEQERWSVTATLGDPSMEAVPYVMPSPDRIVCVVTAEEMRVIVYDDVSVERAARFVRAVREKENATIDRSRGRHRRYQQRT